MLSILIPTYNYNVFPLVSELLVQCKTCGIAFEIICLDDASRLPQPENEHINSLENCSYTLLEKNMGRSAIRNLLAAKAQYDWLLFLDADVMPRNSDFISNYLLKTHSPKIIFNGGILYQKEKPQPSRLLRWAYGRKREALSLKKREANPYLSFLSLNFFVHKSLFETVRFDETLPNLRHEDTVFSYNLMQKNVAVKHIDNPVYHLGIDTFEIAIKKEHESLAALKYLLESGLLPVDYLKIGRYYSAIRKFGFCKLLSAFNKSSKPALFTNLRSKNPSLLVFDLYRLSYLCTLKTPS